MDNFYESDDDYGNLFITQESSRDHCVSLEDNDEDNVTFRSVLDPQYLDISEPEDDVSQRRLR